VSLKAARSRCLARLIVRMSCCICTAFLALICGCIDVIEEVHRSRGSCDYMISLTSNLDIELISMASFLLPRCYAMLVLVSLAMQTTNGI
jgi:hypothetical protein